MPPKKTTKKKTTKARAKKSVKKPERYPPFPPRLVIPSEGASFGGVEIYQGPGGNRKDLFLPPSVGPDDDARGL